MNQEIEQIRAKLIGEQAIHKKEVEEAKKAIQDIREQLSNITEEDITLMATLGIPIHFLKEIDLDRFETDADYLEQCKSDITESRELLYQKLMDELERANINV